MQDLVTQAPAAVAVVIVSYLFLKHLKEEREERARTMAEVSKTCHEHSQRLTAMTCSALDKNSDALNRNTEMIGRNLEALSKNPYLSNHE